MPLYQQKAIKTGRTEHQDTKLTSMRPRLKELNDNPYVANDVEKFLSLHPTITTIVLNGKGDTTKTFEENFSVEELKHRYSILSLPSTSNSNSISFGEKLNSWRIIKEIVEAKS